MEKIVWKERKHKHVLSKTLYKLQQSSVLCDMIINTKTGPILVHRLVLYAFNEILYADSVKQCSSTATAADEFISKFKDFDSNVGLSVVKYLYTGDVMVDLNHMESFCRLCKLLGLDKVISGIEGINGRNSNDTNMTNEDEEESNPEDVEDEGSSLGSEVKGIKSEVEDEDSNEGHSRNESMSLEESLMQQNSALVAVKQEPVDEDFSDNTNNEIASDMFRRCCMKCDKLFENKDAYCSHMTADHGLYICKICEWTDRQQGQLQTHMKNEHPEMTEVPSSSKEKMTNFIPQTMQNQVHVSSQKMTPVGCQEVTMFLKDSQRMGKNTNMTSMNQAGTIEENQFVQDKDMEQEVKCDENNCNFTTDSYPNLIAHKSLDHEKKEGDTTRSPKPFVCAECGKEFKSRYGRSLHIKSVHRQTFRFFCETCNKGFNMLHSYQGHLASHNPDMKEKCKTCHLTFQYKQSLKEHAAKCNKPKKTKQNNEVYKCEECQLEFMAKNRLKKHILGKHTKEILTCQYCEKQYNWPASYYRHMKTHKDIGRPSILSMIDGATSNNDMSVKDGHTNPSGEQLDDNSSPVMIIRSENGTKMTPKNGQTARFSCDQCNVTTNYLSSLKRHKLSMHSNNPNLIRCTACNMFFEDEVKKQEHTEKHHSSRFLCFECGKTYKWKKNYKQHLQMHNNQFNYKCSICDKTFLQKHVYEGHINNHLNINPHHCSVCGASFPYRSSLLRHQQTCPKEKIKEREPIECADCNQPFNSKNALRQHEFAMHSDMSFVCPICGKGYRYRSGLSKHRRLSCTKIEPLILQSDD